VSNQLESSFAEKDLGVLLDNQWNISQQRALAVKGGQQHPGFVRQTTGSELRAGILPLCSALVRPHLAHWVQLWAPQGVRDIDTLERVQ